MPSFDETLEEIHPKTRGEWRSWLEAHHETHDGVWLVYFRASTGKRDLSWEDAVREALCFGWIDSKVQPIDDERYRQIFTPRKPTSVWSRINKQHVADLIEAQLMTNAGLRAIEVAKENGAWVMLEPVDDLIVPEDLAAALQAANARGAYEALSNTDKRQILYSVYTAKRDDTRARRIEQALDALRGE